MPLKNFAYQQKLNISIAGKNRKSKQEFIPVEKNR